MGVKTRPIEGKKYLMVPLVERSEKRTRVKINKGKKGSRLSHNTSKISSEALREALTRELPKVFMASQNPPLSANLV